MPHGDLQFNSNGPSTSLSLFPLFVMRTCMEHRRCLLWWPSNTQNVSLFPFLFLLPCGLCCPPHSTQLGQQKHLTLQHFSNISPRYQLRITIQPHSFKMCMLGRGSHTYIRNASFPNRCEISQSTPLKA